MSRGFIPKETCWPYADFVKAASREGGPDKLVEMIFREGRSGGRLEGVLGAAAVAGTCLGLWKLSEWNKKRKLAKIKQASTKQECVKQEQVKHTEVKSEEIEPEEIK